MYLCISTLDTTSFIFKCGYIPMYIFLLLASYLAAALDYALSYSFNALLEQAILYLVLLTKTLASFPGSPPPRAQFTYALIIPGAYEPP